MDTDWKQRPLVLGGLLVLLTLVACLPALQGGFIWDDDFYVTNNPTLRSPDGLAAIWTQPTATPQYYPLVHSTFWMEYRLWGLNPFGYHLVNVLLHALNAVLLWRVLKCLELPGAWLAAVIFAVHPVHVESVAWITERKNVLCGAFYFGAALAYLRSRYPLAFALFVGAMLSKTVACTLPVALGILLWWKHGRVTWRDVARLAPFLVVGAVLGLTTAWLERNRVGAVGEEWALSLADRCLIAGRAVWFYAEKLVCPVNLSFIYERWELRWWLVAFPVAAVAALAIPHRGWRAAWMIFVATLGPALGFVNVFPMRYSFVADHFQYLASAAVIAVLAVGLVRFPKLAAGVVVLLAALTWRQAGIYENSEVLWRDVIAKNPTCWMAHNNLGLELGRQGKTAEAVAEYRAALRWKPEFPDALVNLGNVRASFGEDERATQLYARALRSEPGHFSARFNLALALGRLGRGDEAIRQYRFLLQLKPDYAEAHYNLGIALGKRGQYEEAMAHFEVAIRLRPDFAEAHHNLAVARRRLAA